MPMMSYDEAAAVLGVAPDSVRRMARKKRWKRGTGNDGRGQVEIPEDYLAARPDRRPDAPPVARPDAREDDREDARMLIARLESELAGVRELVAAERRRGDEAVARADRIEKERDYWLKEAHRPWWKPRRLVAG